MENNKTWGDLKQFISTLSDEQLSQVLALELLDSEPIRNIDFGIVEEDIFIYDDDSEDFGSITVLKECHEDDFDETKLTLVTKKGTVFMCGE